LGIIIFECVYAKANPIKKVDEERDS